MGGRRIIGKLGEQYRMKQYEFVCENTDIQRFDWDTTCGMFNEWSHFHEKMKNFLPSSPLLHWMIKWLIENIIDVVF